MKLVIRILVSLATLFAGQAMAALTVNSVTLNSGASTSAIPGASITVVVSETNNGGSNWGSVRFVTTNSGGTQVVSCVNTTNHNGNGASSETFTVAAPLTNGVYDVSVQASSNDTCGGTTSATVTLIGGIAVGSFFPVPIATGLLNQNITTWTGGGTYTPYMSGNQTFAGVPFTMQTSGTGMDVIWGTSTSVFSASGTYTNTVTLNTNLYGAIKVHTLINSAWGTANSNVGSVTFKATNGDSYTVNLVEGVNVRDHYQGSFVNTTSASYVTTNVVGVVGSGAHLDMQAFALPSSFATEVLSSIVFTSTGSSATGLPFLAGVTVVASYGNDHVRLDHAGTGATCAASTVTVTACQGPDSSGSCTPSTLGISGSVFATNGTGTVDTKTFTIPSGSSSTTVSIADSTAETVTLSAGSYSVTPSSSSASYTCWNSATGSANCSLVLSSSSCASPASNFNVVDSNYADKSYNTAADHRIYTKLAGWDETTGAAGNTKFKVDVVALKSDGTTQTKYAGVDLSSKNVKLEIFDDSSGTACNSTTAACTACSKTVVATVNPVTFIVADTGYQNDVAVSLADTKAYSRLIARITDTNPTPAVIACSSDAFAVRPQTFAVTATTSGGAALLPSSSGATGTTTVKSGAAFTMYADSGAVGYAGTPTIATAKVSDFLGQTSVPFSGSFSAASGTTGKASGTTFSYGEVGFFVLAANAVYDAGFTSSAADDANSDCVVGSFSNTKASGKYGCSIGSAATSWGRFIPDHFDTAMVQVSGVPITCPTGLTCPVLFNGAVYSGQSFTVSTTARNLSGNTTQNYSGGTGYSKAVTLLAFAGLGSTTALSGASAGTLSGNTLAATGFTNGVGTLSAVAYGFTSSPGSPTDMYFRALEDTGGDGVSSLRATNPTTTSVEGGVKVVQGRIRIPNAYGSERLALPMTATVQYFNGNFWVTSLTDSVTTFNTKLSTAGGNLIATVIKGPLTGVTLISPGSAAVSAGVRTFTLAAPLASGSVNLQLNAPVYLPNAGARATFGIFRSPLIYSRENY